MTVKLSPIRAVDVALGAWLFLSAFAWPHSPAQLTNTWIVALSCMVVSVATMFAAEARYVNAALAVWLFVSAFALPALGRATAWNNAIVAVLLFVASLASGEERATTGPRGRRASP